MDNYINFSKKNRKDIIVPIVFLIINLIFVLRLNGEVGLYLDAVNPDYLSVQVLNSNDFSFSISLPYIGIPFLGQIYHGTVTMFVSIVSILLTGKTSAMQLYFTNCLYGTLAAYLLYIILLKTGVKKKISFFTCVLLLLSPNLTATYVTQYYIELPGVIFSLLMLWFLLDWKLSEMKQSKLLIAGICGGLAVYSYFNFIFFMPSVFLIVIKISSQIKDSKVSKNIFVLSAGYALGCIPYIIGYISLVLLAINRLSKASRVFYLIATTILVFVTLIYLYKIQNTYKKNIIISSLIILAGCVLLCIVGVHIYINYKSYFSGLDIAGVEGGIFERLKCLYTYISSVLCHSALEYLVLDKYVTHGLFLVPFITLGMIILVLILYRKVSDSESKKKYKFISAICCCILTYLLCSMVMAIRMQGQHFVCMIFIMWLVFGECLEIIVDYWIAHRPKHIHNIIALGMFAIAIVFIINQMNVLMGLRNTIARGNANQYYSTAINNLSEIALEEKENGKKQYYVFPEWGISGGFDYLTMNTIGFGGWIDPPALQWLRDEMGYEIIVCYWEEENKEDYMADLTNVFEENEIKTDYVSGNYADILELKIENR